MSNPSHDATSGPNFEFQALREARNYRAALITEFFPHIRGRVLEVGAGIGQITALLRTLSAVEYLLAVEPNPDFCRALRVALPDQPLLEGTAATLSPPERWHTIVSINVLEHLRDDAAELALFAQLLHADHGALCLLVPARPEIFAPIDGDFGHFRRYTKPGLRRLLEGAGFQIMRLHYFNFAGYFGWWLNFRFLGQRIFQPAAVRLFDRMIFPWTHRLETRVCRPPIGQSLMAVAKARWLSRRSG